jgi:O-antigen/teichoic acid export membrane protein|tara:strand:+ start:299 stop:1822 length:1524 start_codon:yes stop_codon:yes gene_type:complete
MNLKKILKESVWIYLFVLIAAIAGYLVRALYARNFTVAEYGLFYSVLTFIFLFNTLRNLGFDSSQLFHMNKFLARLEYKKAKAVLFIALIPQMILSILIAAIIFLLKPYLVSNFFKSPISGSMIDILLILFIIQPVIFSLSSAFGSFQKHLLFQLKDFLNIIFVFLLSLLFFNLNFSLLTAPLSYLFAGILTLAVYLVMYKIRLKKLHVKPQYDKKTAKGVFGYAFALSLGSFAGLILPYSDTMILTWMRGVQSVGYYHVVLPSVQIVFLLTIPAINLLAPVAINLFHNKKKGQFAALTSFVYNNFLIFTLPLAIIFFVYSGEIINFIFGSKYLQASLALKIYVIFWIFMFLRRVNFAFLSAIGEVKYIAKALWIGVIFNIILDIILIRYYDYTGAVVATGLGFVIITSLTYNRLRKKTTIRIDYKQQLKILTAGALFLSVAMFLESLIFITIGKLSVVVEGAIVFLTSGSLYVIALVLFKVITKAKIIYLKNLIFKSDNKLESVNQ